MAKTKSEELPLVAQKRKCSICQTGIGPAEYGLEKPYFDDNNLHEHQTGAVCFNCYQVITCIDCGIDQIGSKYVPALVKYLKKRKENT